ncbi:MAG: purine-binding chemotaxis protein CheW [Deltaproteobacteria bacterium]|nr:purine-binding chemotaxis protein CheW [Deltaproteobacteria bacterium]
MRMSLFSRTAYDEERKLIGFITNGVRYGIDIMRVMEIVNPCETVQVPAVPPFVVGVADHRGTIIPIINLRARFGLESGSSDRYTKWIFAKIENREIGLQVDRVTQVLRVTPDQKRDRRSLLNETVGEGEQWIKNVFADDSGLVFEIDLKAVIGEAAKLPDEDGMEREER